MTSRLKLVMGDLSLKICEICVECCKGAALSVVMLPHDMFEGSGIVSGKSVAPKRGEHL
jgi:hypothetical protein